MADKKFTDEEIINALHEMWDCSYEYEECQQLKNALDLINRQKAENLELRLKVNELLAYKQEVTKNHMKNYETYKSQKAEIERLKSKYGKLCEYAEKKELELAEINADISWFREAKFSRLAPAIKEIKAETCKEFADKLKEKSEIVHLFSVCNGHHYMVDIDDIDNLLKEMVGKDE